MKILLPDADVLEEGGGSMMNVFGITAPTLDKWLRGESIDCKLFKKKKERNSNIKKK